MAIWCCNGCVAPERYPGCHSHCPKYIEEKKIHDAQREAERLKRSVSRGVYAQRSHAVHKATKGWRRKYKQM